MGFIFILFSSCLLNPNYINIAAFIGARIIHHFIMIREEKFLTSQYGDEYREKGFKSAMEKTIDDWSLTYPGIA